MEIMSFADGCWRCFILTFCGGKPDLKQSMYYAGETCLAARLQALPVGVDWGHGMYLQGR